MWNRQEMMSRIRECQRQNVPITNYGLVIAMAQGILERALEPFPEALAAYREARAEKMLWAAIERAPQRAEADVARAN
jgi:hypothetical protein